MTHIQVNGWNKGFNKVEFNKFIRIKCGISLSRAKTVVDDVLVGKTVELLFTEFADEDRMKMTELGAKFIEIEPN